MTWRGICLHHSATADGGSSSWGAIRHGHTAVNGWQAIGYHFGIERIDDGAGRRHVEVLVGRDYHLPGAHEPKLNRTHLGVCVVGNYDLAPPPPELWRAAVHQVAHLALANRLDVTAPGVIVGHREVAAKSCPGKLFDLDRFRFDVQARVQALSHDPAAERVYW